jgi:hypothetical protein
MQIIKLLVVPLALGLSSVHLMAAESTSNEIPVTKHQAGVVKGLPDKAVTKDQAAPGRDIPASPHQAETAEAIPLKFGDLDADRNGAIDQTEVENIPEVKQQWSQLDRNGDEQLEEAEFLRFEQESESDHP